MCNLVPLVLGNILVVVVHAWHSRSGDTTNSKLLSVVTTDFFNGAILVL
jgi:hypothetical protein